MNWFKSNWFASNWYAANWYTGGVEVVVPISGGGSRGVKKLPEVEKPLEDFTLADRRDMEELMLFLTADTN